MITDRPTIHSDDLRYVGRGPCGLAVYQLDVAAHEARRTRDIRAQIELNRRTNGTSTSYEPMFTGGD